MSKLQTCLIFFSLVIILILFCTKTYARLMPLKRLVKKWFIVLDYDESRFPKNIKKLAKQYDLAIFDADWHPPINLLRYKMCLIGYISIGEAETYRSYWQKIKDKDWVIEENPHWEGNYYVDIRNKEWQDLIINEVIPGIKAQGFKGLFLDTIDTAEMLEETDSIKYIGAQQAMMQFIRRIRRAYPDLYLISNNGFSILKQIGANIDACLVEDIHTMVDFENDSYKKVPKEDRLYKVRILQYIMKKYRIPVLNIDYADSKDKRSIHRCIRNSRRLGFIPYVAEKNLDRIYGK